MLIYVPRQHHIVVIREMLSYVSILGCTNLSIDSRSHSQDHNALDKKFYFNFTTMIRLGSKHLWVCPLSFWIFIILTSQFKFYKIYYIKYISNWLNKKKFMNTIVASTRGKNMRPIKNKGCIYIYGIAVRRGSCHSGCN